MSLAHANGLTAPPTASAVEVPLRRTSTALSSVNKRREPVTTSTRAVSGWLTKRGHIFKTWQQRFFAMEGSRLAYFTSDSRAKKRGDIRPTRILPAAAGMVSWPSWVTLERCFVVEGVGMDNKPTSLYLVGTSIADVQNWVQALVRLPGIDGSAVFNP